MTSNNPLEDRVERLEQMLLSLAKETWILRDRQKVLETLLEEKEILTQAAIDRYQPSDSLSSQLDDELNAFVESLIVEPAKDSH